MDVSFVTGVLVGAILAGTAVMYAALGEVVSERGGVVNLGVEGAMLIGVSVSALIAWQTGSPWLGLLAGAFAAGVFNLGLAVLAVTGEQTNLRVD